MKFKNLGLIYKIESNNSWHHTHAMVPTPLLLEDKIRVYFSCRSIYGQSHIAFIDLNRHDPTEVISTEPTLVQPPGKLGTFDDCGATPDCIVNTGEAIYLYYIGWNQMVTTPYRNTIGLTISHDSGVVFKKYSHAPIMERNHEEPFFCTSPWVIKENNHWKMWYACITDWILVNNKPEALYHIKYAESTDGIIWNRPNISCIVPTQINEANVRPTVLFSEGKYKMWYCYRGSEDFRDGNDSYRIGYAESKDGKIWERLDDRLNIQRCRNGWDAKMQAYPAVLAYDDKVLMLYNGNSFGKEGFGCAILD